MTAPARRRPGSESLIKLTPLVEEVRTPLTMAPPPASVLDEPAALPVEAPATAAPVDIRPAQAGTVVEPVEPVDTNEKKPMSFQLNAALKKRAETAVLRTSGYEGGYSSMTGLIEGALRRELERLAADFNDGVPFARNDGTFRQGRPLGS